MYRKFLTLVLIAGSLGLVLFVKTYFIEQPKSARIIDRLPVADFLGKVNILELAKETSSLLQYNKLSMRDFTTYEFLLGQGKQYGINLDADCYLFLNENGNWGALINLSDSSKINLGIQRLAKYSELKDTTLGGVTYYHMAKENSYLHYGKDYALIYQGSNFLKVLNRVVSAEYGAIRPVWRRFLRQKQFKNEHLVLYANWPKLRQFDIETAMFAHDSDSTGLQLKSYIKKRTPLYFSMKKDGLGYKNNLKADRFIDIHLDVEQFKRHPKDSVYVQLNKLSRKIGFPFERFMDAWSGDLVYQEGGKQVQQERYIETVLDEDFNETEVERVRYDTVLGFSVLTSLNQKGPLLIAKLFQKGLLRKDTDGFRFLFSPRLHFTKSGPYYQYFSSDISPRMQKSKQNQVIWKYKGTRYFFKLDKLTRHEIYGTLQIPVKSILRRNKII